MSTTTLALEALKRICDAKAPLEWSPSAQMAEAFAHARAALAALEALEAEAVQEPVEIVNWGVDWGSHGDRTCVSIVKRHPDGTLEVVVTEYEPQKPAAPQQAADAQCSRCKVIADDDNEHIQRAYRAEAELDELRLAYAECSRQRNELLTKHKKAAAPQQAAAQHPDRPTSHGIRTA